MFGLFSLIVGLTVFNVFSAVPVLILFGNVSRETLVICLMFFSQKWQNIFNKVQLKLIYTQVYVVINQTDGMSPPALLRKPGARRLIHLPVSHSR